MIKRRTEIRRMIEMNKRSVQILRKCGIRSKMLPLVTHPRIDQVELCIALMKEFPRQMKVTPYSN